MPGREADTEEEYPERGEPRNVRCVHGRGFFGRGTVAATLVGVAMATGACAHRTTTCGGAADCRVEQACVAGRCEAVTGSRTQIQTARRLVLEPVDAAYVGAGAAAGVLPPVGVLGRSGEGAALYLRFDAPLGPTTEVVEAYLLLTRSDAVVQDDRPVRLELARIVERWSGTELGRSVVPRLAPGGGAVTTLRAPSRALVRVDAAPIVRRWRLHDRDDQGLAVVTAPGTAEGASASGVAFVLATHSEASPERDPGRTSEAPGPRLELYLK